MRATRLAAQSVTRLDPRTAELILAGSAIVFGIALFNPVDLAARSPAFRSLVEMLPQYAWAVVWIAMGLLQGCGAVYGVGRRQADVAAGCLWVFWTAIQIMAMGLTVGPFTYGWLALSSVLASHAEQSRGSA
jgi:hypothetical protein